MRSKVINLITAGLLTFSVSCLTREQAAAPAGEPTPTPVPSGQQEEISWPSDPTEAASGEEEGMRRVWADFERSQQYRLARPSDRRLSPAALARVNSNSPGQVIPFLKWWGIRGLANSGLRDSLVAIVVDPGRADQYRYGLVVLAAPVSDGGAYKVYWVGREQDMENYLISPASGSVYIECYRRDGGEQTKELVWDGKSKRFRLE